MSNVPSTTNAAEPSVTLAKEPLRNAIRVLGSVENPKHQNSIWTLWVRTRWARWLMRLCALLSLISVSANTPDTLKRHRSLLYITWGVDLFVALFFTAEMLSKMYLKGYHHKQCSSCDINGRHPTVFFMRHWGRFDFVMVIFLWLSIILQCYEMYLAGPHWYSSLNVKALEDHWKIYGPLSIIRCPRPLILLRVFRSMVKLELSQARANAIFQRSVHQVRNVAMFLLFFMCFYGVLGVQFFGREINYHCVVNGSDPKHIVPMSLAIPDTYCNPNDPMACPFNMTCMTLQNVTEWSSFDDLAISLLTVYQAASQEGWVLIMYRAMSCLPQWKAVLYFFTMIFFLAWLVKNVFIAVLGETFAEIRVQFQQRYTRRNAADIDSSKVFQSDGRSWKLVPVKKNRSQGSAPKFFQETVLRSAMFNVSVMLLVFTDAVVAAGVHFDRDCPKSYLCIRREFRIAEVIFTVLFDVEMAFKVWCLGWRGYWFRPMNKFESLLCVGTTIRIFDERLYATELAYFQVLRVVRLIKISPMLEDFCLKIFSPIKKLGSLVLFTMCILIIISSMSLQLFCYVKTDNENDGSSRFSTFDMAVLQMFTFFTEEAWIQVMRDIMGDDDNFKEKNVANVIWKIFCALYFVLVHCFFALIVLSLFVAVILDNLELEEDIKKLKQLKLRQISAEIQANLPLRLRIFEKFANRPQMLKLSRMGANFSIPRIRESFMRLFAFHWGYSEKEERLNAFVRTLPSDMQTKVRGLRGEEKREAVIFLINESNKMRTTFLDQRSVPQLGYGVNSPSHQNRLDKRVTKDRSNHDFNKINPNGDIFSYSSYQKASLALQQFVSSNSAAIPISGSTNTAEEEDIFNIKILKQKEKEAEMKRTQLEEELRENHPLFDKPLFTIGRDSRIRNFCRRVVEAKFNSGMSTNPLSTPTKSNRLPHFIIKLPYVDCIMVILTCVSVASMTFETRRMTVMKIPQLQVTEYVFFCSMTVEMALKIIANGLIFTPKALLRDFGGVLDVFTYLISVIYTTHMMYCERIVPFSAHHWLMVLRALRPLRIFTLVPHLRQVIDELVRGIREILLVSVLLIVFMFMFAVYGVHLFGGRLRICNDRSITSPENCKGLYRRRISVSELHLKGPHPSILVPRVYANPRNFNFDNIVNAMLALFEVLSLEGWTDVRDIIKERVGPRHVIYIHLFVFIGFMIGLTLFVGVVIVNYSENKGTALLTVDQRRWQDLKGRIKLTQPLHIPPRPKLHQDPATVRSQSATTNESWLSKRFIQLRCYTYDLTQNVLYKRATACVVLFSLFLLCIPWTKGQHSRKADEDWLKLELLQWLAVFHSLLFCIDVTMKILALSPCGYWQSKRNRLDFVVTVAGIIWVLLHITIKDGTTDTIGWVVLIFRFFTITGKHATLKMLMQTVGMSMLKSFFIITCMSLLLLVYAMAGVVLFGNVKYGENLGKHANFRTTLRAVALLFRSVTGEDWNKILHDCSIHPPFCENTNDITTNNCGHSIVARVYFFTFYIIITYIMLNLLVAIIMENFSLFYSNDEDAIMSYTDIRNVQLAWSIIDIHRKGMVKAYYVRFLLRLIPKDRIGLDLTKKRDQQTFKKMCYEVEMLKGGKDREISFHDVLTMLAYRNVDIKQALQLEELIAREELEYAIEEEVARQTIANWIERCICRNRQKHGNLRISLRVEGERSTPHSRSPNLDERSSRSSNTDSQARHTASNTGTAFLMPPSSTHLSGSTSSDDSLSPNMNYVMGMKKKRPSFHRKSSPPLPEVMEDADESETNALLKSNDSDGIQRLEEPNRTSPTQNSASPRLRQGPSSFISRSESIRIDHVSPYEEKIPRSPSFLPMRRLSMNPSHPPSTLLQMRKSSTDTLVAQGCSDVKDWWKTQSKFAFDEERDEECEDSSEEDN